MKIILLFLCITRLNAFQEFHLKTNYEQLVEKIQKHAIVDEASASVVETMWIEQKLDNFDAAEKATFKTQVLMDRSNFTPGGPIILYIGDDVSHEHLYFKYLLLHVVAQQKRGLMLLAEHRYYGNSLPQLDLYNPASYKYLSADQALADLANLIKHIKSWNGTENSKVIVVGGFYAGNLAAWMRLQYPDLVYAAVSSCAPVLAVKDFTQYREKVWQNFDKYGTPGCYDKIVRHFSKVKDLLQTAQGIEQLKQWLNICEQNDLDNLDNQHLLFYYLMDSFNTFGELGNKNLIKFWCSQLGKETYLPDVSMCLNVSFTDYISSFTKQSFYYRRSWYYQKCTEFGYFMTTNSRNYPFLNDISLDFFTKICDYVFGVSEKETDEGIERTNQKYGGQKPQVSNVLFITGDLDPWKTLGVTVPLGNNIVYVIPEEFHSYDITIPIEDDTPEVLKAKEFVLNTVGSWLN